MTMRIIYIGERFYEESGSIMSSIYVRPPYRFRGHIETYARTDWGKVNIALANGKSIEITPATDAELVMFEAELRRVNKEWKEYRVPA